MNTRESLLAAIHADPTDTMAWLALADALEEEGEEGPAEVLRLTTWLRTGMGEPARERWEERLHELMRAGVRPVVPTRTNSLGMDMVLIPPGTFWMGSPEEEEDREKNEGTRRVVTISRPFYLSRTQVTQKQWERLMDDNPAHHKGPQRPVETVSWHRCQDFCNQLSAREGEQYRLPYEAEWEYAARAGTTTTYWDGNDVEALKRTAWCSYDGVRCSARRSRPVARFPPNPFGLHDIHGNVHELCQDVYRARPPKATTDPRGPEKGQGRVLRGGAWHNEPRYCRSAMRLSLDADSANDCCGLRVYLAWPAPSLVAQQAKVKRKRTRKK